MNLKFIEINLLITRRQRIRHALRTKGLIPAVVLHKKLYRQGLHEANEYIKALAKEKKP